VEQLIIIVIFVAIAAANHLLKKSREGDGPGPEDAGKIVRPPRVNRPAARPQETDEERMRRFMEALGVPVTSVPPPRKIARPGRVPQTGQPPRTPARPAQVAKTAPPPPIPASPVQGEPPHVILSAMAETSQTRPEPETSFPEASLPVAVAAVDESPADASSTLKTEPVISNLPENIRAMLRNRDSIRSAILLREILDAPRGLQSYH
jgi:hypothetical protein